MKKKDAIIKLWQECFDDSPEYVDMFFTEVYRDDDALLLEHDGKPVSGMLLQRYAMNFHGVTVSIGYICGAATAPELRGYGNMSSLMRQALNLSHDRGDALCALIPAGESLYRYYSGFCFSPVFYVNEERYTSAHTFKYTGEYSRYENLDSQEAYSFFDRMMRLRQCAVQHTAEQYRQIIMDNSADAGSIVALQRQNEGIVAMAFAVPSDGVALVKDVLAVDDDARSAALDEVHRELSDMPIVVHGYYGTPEGKLLVRGMARIVNVEKIFGIIAQAYPSMNTAVKVYDPLIEANNSTFVIADGTCKRNDNYNGKLSLDIDVEVLTSIVFGNHVTQTLLDFPAERPFMSLMLD